MTWLQDQRAIDMIRGRYATSVRSHVHVSRLRDTSWTEGPHGRANKLGGEMSNRSIQGLAKEREGGRRERENERWSGLRYKAPHGPLGRTCINETQPRSNRIPDRPRHVIPVLDRGLVSKIMLNRCSTCNLYRLQFDFFRIFFFFFMISF